MSELVVEPNRRILVIDDNPAIHEDFQKILAARDAAEDELDEAEALLFGSPGAAQAVGYEVHTASQGEQGLQLVVEANERGRPYALAFVDMRMPPGWDGLETIERIWRVDDCIQIVICTAFSDHSWKEVQERVGRSDRLLILKKPFDNIEVSQLALALTEKHALVRQARLRREALEQMVAARTQELVDANLALRESEQRFRCVFEEAPLGMALLDGEQKLQSVNAALGRMLGRSDQELLGTALCELLDPEDRARAAALAAGVPAPALEQRYRTPTGGEVWARATAASLSCGPRRGPLTLVMLEDVTAAVSAERERARMQARLAQAQKLEAVGRLASGVAHEINTPLQFVGDNARFLQGAFRDQERLLAACERALDAAERGSAPAEVLAGARRLAQEIDQAYLREEVPRAIEQSLDGLERVSGIVQALCDFAAPPTGAKQPVDLQRALRSILVVSANVWAPVAELETDFDPELPDVPGLPAELNQALLAVIVNAAQALAEKAPERGKGHIRVATRRVDGLAEIRISDDGPGIPAEARAHLFEPFFSTRDVGVGRGQGLALARAAVVERHGGSIDFESVEGAGTTFWVRLPLEPS